MLDILKRIDLGQKRFCKKCLVILFKILYTFCVTRGNREVERLNVSYLHP